MTLPDRDAAKDWIGRTVVDRDGAEIGVCAALLADEATGLPEWLYADRDEVTVVVPLLDATESGGRVQVTVTRADADGAPRFGPAHELSQDQEAELYRHYGIEYSTVTSDSLLPAAEAEPTAAEAGPTEAAPTAAAPSGPAPDVAAGQVAPNGTARRGRGVAAAVVALAALAAAVVAAVRLRRGAFPGAVHLPRRGAPPPRTAAQRAVAARARAVRAAAAAGPVVAASGRVARQGASAGAQLVGRAGVDAAQRGRRAATAARTHSDEAAARLAPLLATTGQTAWRAARTGTNTVLHVTDAATVAVGAAVPRAAAGVGRAGRAGLRAVLTVGAVPEVIAETEERLEKGWKRVMSRLSLALGLGVGYVLGARAGRDQYEKIKQAAAGLMGRPEVQQAVEQVRAAAPAPLQSGIDKLSGGGSGGRDASAGTTGDDGTASPSTSGTGGTRGTDGPLPDPLIPPAKSDDGPTGRP